MKYLFGVIVLSASLLLQGCGTTGNGKGVNPPSLTYALPHTSALIELNLVLLKCPVNGTISNSGLPIAKVDATIKPVVTQSPHPDHRFMLDSDKLTGFWSDRNVKIDLHPLGSIKSINTTSTNKVSSIIGGTLSLAQTLAFNPAGQKEALGICKPQVVSMLKYRDQLIQKINSLRIQLPKVSSIDAAAISKQVDALVAEVVRLNTGALGLKLSRMVTFNQDLNASDGIKWTRGGAIRWKQSELSGWMGFGDQANPEDEVSHFSVGYCMDLPEEGDEGRLTGRVVPTEDCSYSQTVQYQSPKVDVPEKIGCTTDGDCASIVVFREPIDSTMHLVVGNTDLQHAKDTVIARGKLSISQWGHITKHSLKAGFGQNRTFTAAFDEFGKTQSISWNTKSTGQGIVAGLNEVATARENIINAQDASDPDSIQSISAELTRLDTLNKYNILRQCQETIEMGNVCE